MPAGTEAAPNTSTGHRSLRLGAPLIGGIRRTNRRSEGPFDDPVTLRAGPPRARDPRGRRRHDAWLQRRLPRAFRTRRGELRLGDGALPMVPGDAGDGRGRAIARSRRAP